MTHAKAGSTAAREQAHRIPAPSGREPLKTNIFHFAGGAACQLLPLFPYLDAGAIVPCGAIMAGDANDSAFGHFMHFNTVEEVAVAFGANQAMLQTGQIFVTQRLHGVNSFLRDSADPEAFILMTITQHQSEDDNQNEDTLFRCQKCSEQLVRHDYNATPKGVEGYAPSQWSGSVDDEVPVFTTIWRGDVAAVEYADEPARTCLKCGHVNADHPRHKWGWSRYGTSTDSAISRPSNSNGCRDHIGVACAARRYDSQQPRQRIVGYVLVRKRSRPTALSVGQPPSSRFLADPNHDDSWALSDLSSAEGVIGRLRETARLPMLRKVHAAQTCSGRRRVPDHCRFGFEGVRRTTPQR